MPELGVNMTGTSLEKYQLKNYRYTHYLQSLTYQKNFKEIFFGGIELFAKLVFCSPQNI